MSEDYQRDDGQEPDHEAACDEQPVSPAELPSIVIHARGYCGNHSPGSQANP
jgi:hypothetical protein